METHLKNIKSTMFNNSNIINNYLNDINNSYINNIFNIIQNLIKEISNDYDISYNELCEKYLNGIKKKYMNIKSDVFTNINTSNILEKKIIQGKTYYIQNKEGGIIYNKELEKLGEINNGEYIFY